ncbi:hypothetical protein [Actinoplanes sp. NPDC049599]|uniref:hypothetical protein n=1 Tax=Actinoplanes sp. NPDC049599 TaxID=3363903 RepID=UPI0037BB5B2A
MTSIVMCTAAGATLLLGAPAEAAAPVGWRTSPAITDKWYCGATTNGRVFSIQACIIDNGGSYYQGAVLVRNRSTATRSASAVITSDRVSNGSCAASGIGASSYSVCFAPPASVSPGVWINVYGGAYDVPLRQEISASMQIGIIQTT